MLPTLAITGKFTGPKNLTNSDMCSDKVEVTGKTVVQSECCLSISQNCG
jgi:hypothetical protein